MFTLPPQDTKKFIRELSTSAADTLAMIATIGDSLLRGIKCWIATLKRQLESEHSSKLEKLQLVARELEAPQQLYQQMKMLLQHHANAVQFLHEHKRLKREMVRLMEGSMSPQIPIKDTISIRRYFQELIRGIDITAFVPPETDQVLASAAGLREAWQAGCATQGRLSQQVLEDILCKAASGSVPKPNEEAKLPGNPSHSSSPSSTSMSLAQGSEVGSRESTVYVVFWSQNVSNFYHFGCNAKVARFCFLKKKQDSTWWFLLIWGLLLLIDQPKLFLSFIFFNGNLL